MKHLRWGFFVLVLVLLSTTGVLAQAGSDERLMDWSPDGTLLLFQEPQPDGSSNLYTINRDGTGERLLLEGWEIAGNSAGALWSPDGKTIALNMLDENLVYGVYVLNVADLTLTQLSDPAYTAYLLDWSPDSSQLMTLVLAGELSNPSFNQTLMNVDGTAGYTLLENVISFGLAGWSPDGQQIMIAGASQLTGLLEAYVFAADGTRRTDNLLQRYLFDGPSQHYFLAWSPDSTRLAFSIDTDSTIYVLDPVTATLVPLVYTGGVVSDLVWTADGSELLYNLSDDVDPAVGLYRVSLDERLPQPIFVPEDRFWLNLSPDSTRAVIHGDEGLMLLDMADGHTVEVNLDYATSQRLVWSPDSTLVAVAVCMDAKPDDDIYVIDAASGAATNLTGDRLIEEDAADLLIPTPCDAGG